MAVVVAVLLSGCTTGPTTTMDSMASDPSREASQPASDGAGERPAGGAAGVVPAAAAAVPVPADYLWVVTSTGGRVEGVGVDSGDESLRLVMTGVHEYATQFTDRPDRHAYVLPTDQFVQLWPTWFADAAPNSVLAFEDGSTDSPRTVVLELFDPVYSAGEGTLTFRARHLHSQPAVYPGVDLPQPPPVTPPETFTSASLFVDPANVGPKMYGMAVGYWQKYSTKDYSSMPDGYLSDLFATIAPYTEWITNYGLQWATDEALVKAAHNAGLKVAATVEVSWTAAGANPDNQKQLAKAIELVNGGFVDSVVIGNEVNSKLNGYPYPDWANDMVAYVAQVKSGTGGKVPVGTSYAGNVYDNAGKVSYEKVNGACDFVQITVHPANWARDGGPPPPDGPITDTTMGLAFLDKSYRDARKQLDDWGLSNVELQIRETGWPTAADSGNAARDGLFTVANAADYLQKVLGWASANNVKVFWFEAIDEPQKAPVKGDQYDLGNYEANWGMWHFTPTVPASIWESPTGPWGTFEKKY